MRETVRRNAVIIFAAIAICGVMMLFSGAMQQNRLITVSALADHEKTVVLDAGHGGFDGGTVANGATEKDLNLAVAKELEIALLMRGYRVVMLRDTDAALGNDKKSDMRARLELLRKYPQSLFISIHMNQFRDASCRGSQIFYGEKNPESMLLAESVRAAIADTLQPDNTRQTKPGSQNSYLLKNAAVPAVIVECGFLSNLEECKMLQERPYQAHLAAAIANGIDNYIGKG